MRGQVSFEALINVVFLMIILGMIVWSVDVRMPSLSNSASNEFLIDSCRKVRNAVLMSGLEQGTTTFADFSDFLNISFNGSYGFSLSQSDNSVICKLFSNSFVNSSFNSVFVLEVNSLSVFNDGNRMVLS